MGINVYSLKLCLILMFLYISQTAASENVVLKDEVDALRETAAKAATLESTVASYKKRMEEHVDLRRQVCS